MSTVYELLHRKDNLYPPFLNIYVSGIIDDRKGFEIS